jgi:GDP-D-mannose 3',5'-epimerase
VTDQNLVAGGGDFIAGHLARRLLDEGHHVRCVDVKPFGEWHQLHGSADNRVLDLSLLEACREATKGVTQVFDHAVGIPYSCEAVTQRGGCDV